MSETNNTKPNIFKRLFIFGSTPSVFMNCLGMFLLSGILLWLSFSLLKCMSNHGQTYEVPDFTDQHVEDVLNDGKNTRFEIVINDTTYVHEKDLGIVLHQDPKPLARAKEGRLIYLTINSHIKPKREIPKLYGTNFKHAIQVLESLKFEHEIVKRVVDSKVPGAIMKVMVNGKIVDDEDGFNKENAMANVGDKVELVISEEFDAGPTQIPDLMCLTYAEAKFKIRSGHNLMLGNITVDGSVQDSAAAYVVAQFPHYMPGQFMKTGDQIDLRLSQRKPSNCDPEGRIKPKAGDYPKHKPDPDGRW